VMTEQHENLNILCHNPSLGFVIKVRVCKGVSQDWARESHFMLLEVQKSVRE